MTGWLYWQAAALVLAGAALGYHFVLIRRNLREISRCEALNDLLLQVCVTAYHARMAPILQAWADATGATVRVHISLSRGEAEYSYGVSNLENHDKSTM